MMYTALQTRAWEGATTNGRGLWHLIFAVVESKGAECCCCMLSHAHVRHPEKCNEWCNCACLCVHPHVAMGHSQNATAGMARQYLKGWRAVAGGVATRSMSLQTGVLG